MSKSNTEKNIYKCYIPKCNNYTNKIYSCCSKKCEQELYKNPPV